MLKKQTETLKILLFRKHLIVLSLIVLLAVFLRFYALKTLPPGLYPDEAMNGNNASASLATGHFQVFYPENNGREGLFILLEAPFIQLLGHHAWALRATSAVIGSLSVYGVFLMLRELAKTASLPLADYIGLVGSFFLATSTWHLVLSRDGFRAILAPCILIFAIYFLLRALKYQKLPLMLLAGIVMGLGFYSYTSFRIMPLVLICLIPLLTQVKNKGVLLFTYLSSVFITSLPLLDYFSKFPGEAWGRASSVSIANQPHVISAFLSNLWLSITMLFLNGDLNWRQNISGAAELSLPLGLLLLVGIWLGFVRKSTYDRLLLLWLVLGAIPMAISDQALPHALRAIMMLPAIVGLASSGAVWLYQSTQSKLQKSLQTAIVACLGSVLILNAWVLYFVQFASNPAVPYAFAEKYTDLSAQINAIPAGQDVYVVLTQGDPNVCGVSICAQSVLFLTNTYLPSQQQARKIHYLTPSAFKNLTPKSNHIFFLD